MISQQIEAESWDLWRRLNKGLTFSDKGYCQYMFVRSDYVLTAKILHDERIREKDAAVDKVKEANERY